MKCREKQRDQNKHSKYQESQKQTRKFNLNWDPEEINYRTQIPDIPEKPKHKPDEQSHMRKLEEIQKQADQYKAQRKLKKEKLQEGTKQFDQNINELNYNIELAHKCLKVLNLQLDESHRKLGDLENKIRRNKLNITKNQQEPVWDDKKQYSTMNQQQLRRAQQRILSRMSTESLNKKQEASLNSMLNEIGRHKATAPKSSNSVKDSQQKQIADAKVFIQRSHNAMTRIKEQIDQINMKIGSIQDDIEDFKTQRQQLQNQKKNRESTSSLLQQANQLKEKIYKVRKERQQAERAYQTRLTEYDYQQEKIKWIKWATEVQETKNREWEEEKQRKKQQLKYKQGHKDNKGQLPKQEGQKKDWEKPERTKINHYQPLIDNCSFLITYCKGLYPNNENEHKNKKTENVDVQQIMKQGQWSKMKGVEVIVPKKKKQNKEVKKGNQNVKELEGKEQTQDQKFSHTFFIDQAFQKVNLISPTSQDELDKVILDLQEKQKYYLQHPEGKVQDKKFHNEKSASEVYTKIKTQQHNKRGFNNDDFPTLS